MHRQASSTALSNIATEYRGGCHKRFNMSSEGTDSRAK